MKEYVKQIDFIPMERSRRQQYNDKATEDEYDMFTSSGALLIWAGYGTFPQASFIRSYLPQNAPHLKVRHIIEASKRVKLIKGLSPIILFRKIRRNGKTIEIWNYSHASFNISSGRDYGPAGMLLGLIIDMDGG